MSFILILTTLLTYVYQDADSLLVMSNDSLIICGNHQYNLKIHLLNGGKLKIRQGSASSTDTLGWLVLQAPLIYIHDSSAVNGLGMGYPGGSTSHPNGYGPGYGYAGTTGGGGGGGLWRKRRNRG